MEPRGSGRGTALSGALLVVLVAISTVLTVGPTPTADATSIVPFAPVFSTNDNGSIAVFGNNLMTCSASVADCAATRAGTTNKNNNSYAMVHLDVDGAAFPTYSSSSAEVVLPADSEVRWAGLYWGGRLGTAPGGIAAVGNGTQMKLRGPGDAAYRTITATRPLYGPSSTADRAYQAFADVTSIVQATGPGVFTGADVPAATGEDRYAGWALVVVYRSPSLPLRNLTVFAGLADVGQNDPQTITISGFRTPVSGPVNVRLGMVAYEGDKGSSGDRAVLEGTQLATSISQGTNFFNGSNDDNGTYVTRRTPADRNMLGFDIKNFDAPGILANNASSAQIDLASTSERYFPGVVTTAIDVFAPDFSPSTKTVTNLTGGTPARVGDRLRYSVTFTNAGQDPAINTSISDPIPPGTAYVPGSLVLPGGVSGTFDAGTNSVEVSPGNFPVGRSVTFTFDVDVGAGAADTNVANRATITYDGATLTELQDLTFSTRAATIPVIASADLSITKTNDPATVIAGTVVVSTIVVTNDGPNTATDVVVADQLPAGAGSVTADAPGTCIVNSVLLSCQLGSIAPGDTATITVRTTVPPGSTVSSVTDVATVSSTTSDPDPSDNVSSASSDVTRSADLSITKTATPTTVTPGDTVAFTIRVANAGPSTATDVVITDLAVDPEVVFVGATGPGGACPFVAEGARCTIPSIAPGETVEMTVNGVVTPGTPGGVALVDSANVSSATPDPGPGPNNVTASVTTGPAVSNLTITKTASAPTPLVAGAGEVRYAIDVANTGPSRAEVVTLTDVLPAGFAVVSATSDRGTCATTPAPTGDTVDCSLGALTAPFLAAPGGRARITIVAAVQPDVAPGTYPNTATVDAPSSPPVTSAPATVTVDALANLTVVKSLPEGTATPLLVVGDTLTYRVRVTNAGPSVATNAFVSDTLPPTLSPIGANPFTIRSINGNPAGPFPACEPTRCELGAVGPDTTIELELVVRVDALPADPAAGFVNRADVGSDTADPNDSDNASTFTLAGPPQADVGIRKLAPSPDRELAPVPAPVAGLNTSYILEIVNYGPTDAPNFVFTDELPPGVDFVRAFEPLLPPTDPNYAYPTLCSTDGLEPETVTCDFRNLGLPPGFEFPAFVGTRVGIEVFIPADVPDGTVLANTASVSTTAIDGNPGNNSSTATVAVRAVTNLRVEKLVVEMNANGDFVSDPPVPLDPALDPLLVRPGHAVSFGLVVTNDGPSVATDVQLFDAFPIEGNTLPVYGECQFLNGEVVCRPDGGLPLAPGATFSTQIISLPDPDTPLDEYVNTARVSTATDETTYDDNVASRPIRIDDPVADLIVDKRSTTSPIVAGGTFSYQIEARAGRIDATAVPPIRLSSNAENVEITDALPAGLLPTSATTSQGTCSIVGQVVTCQLGTLASTVTLTPATPAIVTISGTVAPDVVGTQVVNTAVATTSTKLPLGADDVTATATTPVARSADLSITKTASSPTITAGDQTTFTMNVTNTGPSEATGIVLTDLLPAPLVFVATGSDPSCTPSAGRVECTIASIASGETVSIQIVASVPPGAAAGTITNSASVVSDVDDPDTSDDSATVAVDVVQSADLSVTKTAAAEGVLLGGTVTYTLVAANAGPSDAVSAVLTESIPPGTTVATLPPGCIDDGAGTITCALGTLAAGSSATLTFDLAVPDTLQPGALDNTATVGSDTPDPDGSNDTDTVTVEAVAQADVTLTKTLVTTDPVAGEPLVYLLTLVNHGPTVAPNASLSDPIPVGTTFVSFTPSQGECQLDDVEDVPAASCNLGRIEVDATATATLVVLTDPNATTVTNTGYGGSGGLDDQPADNEDTVVTALGREADLSVTKTGPAEVSAAAVAEYVVGYRNDGPSTAIDVIVTDTLPAGLTPRATPGCTILPAPAGSTVSCPIAVLTPGSTGSITVVADVDPALPIGTPLTDTATIASTDTDLVDPDTSDNAAQLTSVVAAENDIAVDVTAEQVAVPAGAIVGYRVVVTNNGPHVATGVTLSATIPPELLDAIQADAAEDPTLVVAALVVPPECSVTGATATCALGDLSVGQSRTLRFGGLVRVGTLPGTQLSLGAIVSFDDDDAVEANNADADSILVIAEQVPTPTTIPPVTIPPATPSPEPPPAGGSGGPSGNLPVTGTTVLAVLAIGVALTLAGGVLWSGSRRRRRPTAGS